MSDRNLALGIVDSMNAMDPTRSHEVLPSVRIVNAIKFRRWFARCIVCVAAVFVFLLALTYLAR